MGNIENGGVHRMETEELPSFNPGIQLLEHEDNTKPLPQLETQRPIRSRFHRHLRMGIHTSFELTLISALYLNPRMKSCFGASIWKFNLRNLKQIRISRREQNRDISFQYDSVALWKGEVFARDGSFFTAIFNKNHDISRPQ